MQFNSRPFVRPNDSYESRTWERLSARSRSRTSATNERDDTHFRARFEETNRTTVTRTSPSHSFAVPQFIHARIRFPCPSRVGPGTNEPTRDESRPVDRPLIAIILIAVVPEDDRPSADSARPSMYVES